MSESFTHAVRLNSNRVLVIVMPNRNISRPQRSGFSVCILENSIAFLNLPLVAFGVANDFTVMSIARSVCDNISILLIKEPNTNHFGIGERHPDKKDRPKLSLCSKPKSIFPFVHLNPIWQSGNHSHSPSKQDLGELPNSAVVHPESWGYSGHREGKSKSCQSSRRIRENLAVPENAPTPKTLATALASKSHSTSAISRFIISPDAKNYIKRNIASDSCRVKQISTARQGIALILEGSAIIKSSISSLSSIIKIEDGILKVYRNSGTKNGFAS